MQWNPRETSIYATPKAPPNASSIKELFSDEPLSRFSELLVVTTKDYVGKAAMEAALRGRARDILSALAQLRDTGAVGGRIVEPTVFVEWLAREVREIRKAVTAGVTYEAAKTRALRTRLQAWATTQGMSAPKIEVLYERASAQLTYRILG